MMELVNHLVKNGISAREALEPLTQLLAPFAPHLAEEAWALLGHEGGISYVTWPSFDPTKLVADEVVYPVQVNGKLRAQLALSASVSKEEALAAAKAESNVARYLEGKELAREIFVPKRMINFVVKG